jgi:hypothetical protein
MTATMQLVLAVVLLVLGTACILVAYVKARNFDAATKRSHALERVRAYFEYGGSAFSAAESLLEGKPVNDSWYNSKSRFGSRVSTRPSLQFREDIARYGFKDQHGQILENCHGYLRLLEALDELVGLVIEVAAMPGDHNYTEWDEWHDKALDVCASLGLDIPTQEPEETT